MRAGDIVLAVEGASTIGDHLAGLRDRRPRVFWLGLALALLVHVVAIVGIGVARPRSVGAPDGAQDAISVELVDAATLRDSMAPPAPPSSPPGTPQPTPTQTAQQPTQPPPEPQAEPEPPAPPEPPPPEVAALPAPPEAAPTPPETPPVEKKEPQKLSAEALPALEDAPTSEEPKPEAAPEPPKEQVQPKEAQPKQQTKQESKQPAKQPPRKKTAALDLSVPYDTGPSSSDAGSSSAVQRPPGITRSGENDEFARNVIRALQKTMPRERNAIGRVTVRIVLTEDGGRADVKLLKSGGNPDLDFNVMFAARQTAYPFPPHKSTLVDRTFTVTYIYR